MHSRVRPLAFAIALAALLPVQARAQQAGLMADLLKDMHDVHGKLVALAKATPEEKMSYRPSADVRSTGEVGRVEVTKTESKGKAFKRVRIRVSDAPQRGDA